MRLILVGLFFFLTCHSANAALLSRAGGLAYYDDVLNVTWLADANWAATNTFGVSGILANGAMTWGKANEWIGAMNAANYLGTNDWRLPVVAPLNGSSFNYASSNNGWSDYGYNQSAPGTDYAGSPGSELAHLFFNTLSNKALCDPVLSTVSSCTLQSGSGLTNTGPFTNFQAFYYWSGTTYAPNTNQAWVFYFPAGRQISIFKGGQSYAWAMRSGDIAAVPIPGGVWLLGSALGAIGWMRRRA